MTKISIILEFCKEHWKCFQMIEKVAKPSVDIIESVFRPIIGFPCWGSKRIVGSIVSLEFGVVARFPQPSPYYLRMSLENPDDNIPVKIIPAGGEWNFSLVDASWTIRVEGAEVSSNSSTGSEMIAAINLLNGQTIERVNWGKESDLKIFFREGGQIYADIDTTIEPDRTVWWLLQTDGAEASLDGNGVLTLSR